MSVADTSTIDLDKVMQSIREEIDATSPGSENTRLAARTEVKVTGSGAPPATLPPTEHRRRLRDRVRGALQRWLGVRQYVKLGQQIKAIPGGPLVLGELPSRVDELARRLTAMEEAIAAGLGDKHQALATDLEEVATRLGQTEDALAGLQARLARTESSFQDAKGLEAKLQSLESDLGSYSSHHRRLEGSVGDHGGQLAKISSDIARVDTKIRDHWRYIADQTRRLDILVQEARRRLPEPLDAEQVRKFANESENQISALYVSFEDRYRGTRDDIMGRQKVYLPTVRDAVAATKGGSILDIGCGRGEFLELLRAEELPARGVDLNPVMVHECRERGLAAEQGDAVEVLGAVPTGTLACVSGFHIIEHLPFPVLIALFDDALRSLAPGGVLIFETPNPANLLVAAERFYLDPTHRNPLPSEMISFMAEARGFVRVSVLPLHPVPGTACHDYEDPMLKLLQSKIYGPQDYGLVAWKAR